MLVLGIGVFIILLLNLDHIRKIKSWKILITGYILLLCGWIFTVLEGFFIGKILNFLEHLSYLSSSFLMVSWTWKSGGRKKTEDKP